MVHRCSQQYVFRLTLLHRKKKTLEQNMIYIQVKSTSQKKTHEQNMVANLTTRAVNAPAWGSFKWYLLA